MGPVAKDFDAVPSRTRQRQVWDGEGDQQRDVPTQGQILRGAWLEMPVQPKQLTAVLVQDANFDRMLAVGFRTVKQQADRDRPMKGGRQLRRRHRIESAAKDKRQAITDLDGFRHHRPIELHRSHSYIRPKIKAPER